MRTGKGGILHIHRAELSVLVEQRREEEHGHGASNKREDGVNRSPLLSSSLRHQRTGHERRPVDPQEHCAHQGKHIRQVAILILGAEVRNPEDVRNSQSEIGSERVDDNSATIYSK
jgi:hypothetical protein